MQKLLARGRRLQLRTCATSGEFSRASWSAVPTPGVLPLCWWCVDFFLLMMVVPDVRGSRQGWPEGVVPGGRIRLERLREQCVHDCDGPGWLPYVTADT